MGQLFGPLATVATSVIGNQAASGDQNSALQARLNALAAYQNLNIPTIAEQQVAPTMEAVQGQINPTLQGTVQQGPSAMMGIQTDPRLKQAQMAALQSLQQQGQGGMTAQERAMLQQIQNQSVGAGNAASQAIMQNMAARGMGGGGAELAARLSAAQGAANNMSQQGLQVAAQGQQNALAAMQGAGGMASGMQAQQFGQQAAQAQSQNAINQFNAANMQNVMGQNVGAQNQAQYYNLGNAQQIANQNVAAQNQAQYYNSGLYQQNFQNQLAQAGGEAGTEGQLGNYYNTQAADTRGQYAKIGQAIGGGLTSALSGTGSGGTGATSSVGNALGS